MNPSEYGHAPWFGKRWQPRFWLLPLVLGIGIGALIFGLPSVLPWGREGRAPHRFEARAAARGARAYGQTSAAQEGAAQARPGAPGTQSTPQARPNAGRNTDGEHGSFDRRDRGGPFFGFGGLSLLVPLLLIGTGVWLLTGRHRGPGGWGGPPRPRPSEPGTLPSAPNHSEPPATSETRWL